MTLAQACEHLRNLLFASEDKVHFAKYGSRNNTLVEQILSENGIIRFMSADLAKRTYLVDYKRLNAVESEDGA